MKTGRIITSIIWVSLWWFLSEYLLMPTFGFSASWGIYLNITICTGILAVIWFIGNEDSSPIGGLMLGIAIMSFIIPFFISISSWNGFGSEEYQQLLGGIEEKEFSANIQPISPSRMIIVDQDIAKRIGEKELGTIAGLGSSVELGNFTLQTVKGELYWIAPLLHSGFFKWKNFGDEGTTGYVRVSATNQEDYALITNVNGKKMHIIYQTGAYFGQDLDRHVYTNGYRSTLVNDFTFEVDDEGYPYWTAALFDTKVGFSGDESNGVITIDPETGEIKRYTVQNAPKWIDRIQPEGFIRTQIDDWGRFIHGAWNWSKRDIKRVASESSIVLGNDGRAYYYYGLTSAGNEASTVGFAMIDTRTKKAFWFKQAGATEDAAKASAEGKVQEKGYEGSDGITYNIDGKPTYEFLLKDKAGLMKMIALVSVHDHTIVGVGESRQEALQEYRTQLFNRGNTVSTSSSNLENVVAVSKIKRFGTEIIKGSTYYYMTIEKDPRKIFMAGKTISNELPLTREGDRVFVKYVPTNSPQEVSLSFFDNLELGIIKDPLQLKNEKALDSVRQIKIEKESGKVTESKWDALSDEEKKKLLKSVSKN